jgi:uncharacterized protein (DUF362 family)/short-subunit dehydrogenase/NAD-dependent dihydropyrimidine dehydrogenase PreA subunit
MEDTLMQFSDATKGNLLSNQPTVVVARHQYYGDRTHQVINNCLRTSFGGNITTLFRNRNVLVKPTLQHGKLSNAEHRLTTHPDILRALVEVLIELGAKLSIGNVGAKPGKHLEDLIKLSKYHNIPLIDFQSVGYRVIQNPTDSGKVYLISNALLDPEHVFNCANLQMHRKLRLVGGIKNMMNAIPRRQQNDIFRQLHDVKRLSKPIVDIFSLINPSFTLLDLTTVRIAQTSNNEPIFVEPKCLVASTDPVAAESTACRLVGFNPNELPALTMAERQGLGTLIKNRIKIVGDGHGLAPEQIITPRPAEIKKRSFVKISVDRSIDKIIPKHIVIQRDLCVRCGDCEEQCPTDAIQLDSLSIAVVDDPKCTSCGLCIDVCANNAIKLERTFYGRPISKISSNVFESIKPQTLNNESSNVTLPLKSRIWEKMKSGVTVNVGPIRVQTRMQRQTCKNEYMSKINFPKREMLIEETENQQPIEKKKQQGLILIVGAGKNLGLALTDLFSSKGYNIALCARNIESLEPHLKQATDNGVCALAFQADASKDKSIKRLYKDVCERMGLPDIVVYNVEAFCPGTITEISASAFRESWEANCLGGFLAGKEAAIRMLGRGKGTIIFTGATASTRGKAGYINLAVGKVGLRALAQCMAKELGPKGIHVAHVVLDGGMLKLNPVSVAKNYWHLHQQSKSAWTFEIDLRPHVEPW